MLDAIDHIVLYVSDAHRACVFYERIGLKRVLCGVDHIAVSLGSQLIKFRTPDDDPTHHATHPLPGSAEVCFRTNMDIYEVRDRLEDIGVEIVDGPVERKGATGAIMSVYIRDPDGNLLEIAREMNDQE